MVTQKEFGLSVLAGTYPAPPESLAADSFHLTLWGLRTPQWAAIICSCSAEAPHFGSIPMSWASYIWDIL